MRQLKPSSEATGVTRYIVKARQADGKRRFFTTMAASTWEVLDKCLDWEWATHLSVYPAEEEKC
jgi:hypothetical protein